MNSFFIRWVFYCAAGEFLGIAAASAIVFGINNSIREPETFVQKSIVLCSMMIAGAIEGFLLGSFQWKVLKEKIPILPWREWTGYTVLVATMGWFLGMMPSLLFYDNSTPDSNIDHSNPIIFALLSVLIGLGIGSVFGCFQWFSLRKYIPKAHRWIADNGVGWAFGIGWIYLASSLPDINTPLVTMVYLGMAGGILAGISVGLVTGIFLKKVLKS
ncbi:MAG: hypothetical protein K2X86_08255 [Cytophagaceae bacterium]|nr:hypothetical protein [Cytophagaceae bacterium]